MPFDNSPPAFPRPASIDTSSGTLPDGDEVIEPQDGMTLRDYFAAHAVSGMIASTSSDMPCPKPADAARYAYRVADAMIAERDT